MYLSTGSGKSQRKIDRGIFACVVILLIIGIIMVFSSTYYSLEVIGKSKTAKLVDHLIRLSLGFILMFVFMMVPSKYYKKYSLHVFVLSLIPLILVLTLGREINGARRWLSIGPLQFQPSELAKFTLIFFLSALISQNRKEIRKLKFFLLLTLPVAVVVSLTFIQPSVSMATLILLSSFALIFVAGVRLSHLFMPLLSVIITAFTLYSIFPQKFSHVKTRIEHFQGEELYQTRQAKIAIAEGRLFGKGIGRSSQKLFYLPQARDDFIFSIISEEFGFVGGLIVIILFTVFVIRGFKVAEVLLGKNFFEGLLTFGITFMIGIYAFVHIIVNCGLGPTTGLPLPYISYGGTSLLINLAATGVLLGLSAKAGESAE